MRKLIWLFCFVAGLFIGWILGFMWDVIIIYMPHVQESIEQPIDPHKNIGDVNEFFVEWGK